MRLSRAYKAAEKAAQDAKAARLARENLDRIIDLHEEFLAKVPGLDYEDHVREQILRGGKAYLEDLRRAR